MLEAQVLHPKDLSGQDAALWRALCAAEPAFANPLFGPDFAQAVGAVRDDARVAVLRRDGQIAGFLAHHRRPGGLARPIGAPLSDYHAVITGPAPGFTGPQALAVANLSALRFTGMVDPHGLFAGDIGRLNEAYSIELDEPPADYLERLRAVSPKKFKNYRRLASKLERDLGELTLVGPDRSDTAFETLVAWKREQLRRTGLHDFMGPDWIRDLMRLLFESSEGDFQGLMVNLYAGGRLVAGQFGVRLGGVYHPWLASADPDLAPYSPGQLFLSKAIAAMPDMGLTLFDLGPGHDHYKRAYALTQRQIGEGLASAPTRAGQAQAGWEGVWALAGAHGEGITARLRRRLDAIATVELTLSGRAFGFAQALADQVKRRRAPVEAD